jgi:hypothetical protein
MGAGLGYRSTNWGGTFEQGGKYWSNEPRGLSTYGGAENRIAIVVGSWPGLSGVNGFYAFAPVSCCCS